MAYAATKERIFRGCVGSLGFSAKLCKKLLPVAHSAKILRSGMRLDDAIHPDSTVNRDY
jgi:hypothetical protein